MKFTGHLAPAVQKLDRAIHRINLIQWISIRGTNCTMIHWIEIYTVDNERYPPFDQLEPDW